MKNLVRNGVYALLLPALMSCSNGNQLEDIDESLDANTIAANGRADLNAVTESESKCEKCFEIVFPHTVVLPDGSKIELTSNEDRSKIKEWKEANKSSEKGRPTFEFPISITKDGNTQEIADEEAFKTLRDECIAAGKAVGPKRHRRRPCFEIKFPHTLVMGDGTEIVLTSKEDRSKIKDWREANTSNKTRPVPKFPITIVQKDGTEQVIDSVDALKAAHEACKAACEASGDCEKGKGRGGKGSRGRGPRG